MSDAPLPGPWQNLLVQLEYPSATITVNRPHVLNALDRTTLAELAQVLRDLDADPHVRGVIITGSGERSFVAGADIRELQALSGMEGTETSRMGQAVFSQIENLSKPSIAAVNGFALGGGCELALACDIRLASDNARLGLPEVGLGLIPGYGGTQRLPRLIGKARALELMLTGDPVHAEEALRIGLVNRVVPQAELLTHAREIVKRISHNAPLAVAAARRAVLRGLDVDLARGLDLESLHFGVLCSTQDKLEGLTAFLEKRKAAFGGH